MSLLNRDYSGFFPFWTVPYSRVSPWGYEMPLSALTQCFWLAKSATLTMALGYNNSLGPDVGTVTGSGVISDGPSGSYFMSLAPAQRAAYSGTAGVSSGLISSPPVTPFGCAGNFDGTPYTQGLGGLFLSWFNAMPLFDTLSPQGPVAFDPVANKWYTDLGFGMGIGVTAGRYDVSTGADSSSTAVFYLKLSGATFATIPINSATSPDGSTALSGSLSLDFDTFWTP